MPDNYGLVNGDPQNPTFSIGISETVIEEVKTPKTEVAEKINKASEVAHFMETLRGVGWSRAYDWYAEMDGVPAPFHRGGNIGLPIKDLSFKIAEGTTFSFSTSSVETLEVPRTMGNLGVITLSLIDDENQTLARFFERWYNQVYNPYKGVLPLTEACKMITIYKQFSTRKNLKRVYYDIDSSVASTIKGSRSTEGYDFIVFPSNVLQFSWGTDSNDLNTLEANLIIAHFSNQDFGNPLESTVSTNSINRARENVSSGLNINSIANLF